MITFYATTTMSPLPSPPACSIFSVHWNVHAKRGVAAYCSVAGYNNHTLKEIDIEGLAFAADVLRIEAVGNTGLSVLLLLTCPIVFLSKTYIPLPSFHLVQIVRATPQS